MAYYVSDIIVKVEDDSDEEDEDGIQVQEKILPKQPPKKKFKKFMCEICNKSFSYGTDLERHMVVHSGEKPYTCDVCGKGLSNYYYMLQHKNAHTGERPYTCNACGKSFSLSNALSTHKKKCTGEKESPEAEEENAGKEKPKKKTNPEDSVLTCDLCKKTFKHRGNLLYHKRAVHTLERRFVCKYCGKAFTAGSTLVVHRRIHTNEKPYSCELCGKAFPSSSSMKTHQKKKHPTDHQP